MMRQKNYKKKAQKKVPISACRKQRCFRVIGMILCLVAILTGCENADKALVFSTESLSEDLVGTTENDWTERDNWQQSEQQNGNADAEVLAGLAGSDSGKSGTDEGLPETGSEPGKAASEAAVPMIYVHVCGAVLQPGVVEVPLGSRAEDALEAAGGFSPEADSEYVNLASPVEDGQQLYFPTMEEAERWRAGMTVSRSGQILTESTNGLININTADETLLCTLPGIGQTRAQAIIAYRQQKGPFERPEDIMKVDGIKQSAFDKISDKITVE